MFAPFLLSIFGWFISLLASSSCLADPPNTHQSLDQDREQEHRLILPEVMQVFPTPKPWETKNQENFQNRGIAQIEKLGREYVLTIYCRGIHQVYIHRNQNVNLQEYLGKFLRVRYKYVDVKKKVVKCFKAPCQPISERRIIIQGIEVIPVSDAELDRAQAQCE